MKGIFKHLPWIIGILFFCFIVLFPLSKSGFPVTDDGDWMIIRLSAFYQSLREGQFPVRFLGRLNYQYGYPVSNFLYPGFLYLGSIIHVFGFSFVMTVKIILALSVVFGATALYIAFWEYSPFIRTIAAISFVTSPYLYYDLYKRGSVGEVLAMAVAIISFLSIKRGWLFMFAPLIGFLILSHNSLSLIFGGFLITYIVLVKKFHFLKSVALGVGMASFFWVPALLEQRYVWFNSVAISDPTKYFVSLSDVPFIGMSFIIAFAIGVSIVVKKKMRDDIEIFLCLFAFVVIYIFVTPISYPLWNIQSFARLFQFPYRFLALFVIIGPVITAYSLKSLGLRGKMIVGTIMIAGMVFQIARMMPTVDIEQKTEGFYTTNEATTTVADEYMPRWVISLPKQRAYERMIIYNGQGSVTLMTKTFQNLRATITTYEPSTIQLNYVYYPGWGISVNGQRADIRYDNPEGFMRFQVPKGTFTVLAQFRETPFRFLIDVVSGLCIISWLIYSTIFLLRQHIQFSVLTPKPVKSGKKRKKHI